MLCLEEASRHGWSNEQSSACEQLAVSGMQRLRVLLALGKAGM